MASAYTTTLCPECGLRQIGRYDLRCVECMAREWLGLTHLPRSHTPTVLTPEDGETIPDDATKEE